MGLFEPDSELFSPFLKSRQIFFFISYWFDVDIELYLDYFVHGEVGLGLVGVGVASEDQDFVFEQDRLVGATGAGEVLEFHPVLRYYVETPDSVGTVSVF